MRWAFALTLLIALLHRSFVGAAPPVEKKEGGAHWAFRKPTRPAVPRFSSVADRAWVRNPIDAFVLAELVARDLSPAPQADRQTLLRRLCFDLTGLPPTRAQMAAFLKDSRSDAYERLVERLLASPHYGEQWGKHWLDVVRFAETEGFEYDRHRAGGWRYRDFVIRAFNEDRPYDRFVIEQLAGDELLSSVRQQERRHELLVASGFHRLGPVRRNAGNQEVASSRNEVLTERTDAVGAVFLGLTVGCARCHDHKFDPFTQKDYYRLQAFLAATHEHDVVVADNRTQADWKARTQPLQDQIKKLKQELANAEGEALERIRRQLKDVEGRLPAPLPTISTVRNDEKTRTPIHVLKRGNWEKKGVGVGPRLPSAFVAAEEPELPADSRAPRSQLAKWITSSDNPLAGRVLVNRVWQYHFGRGIVETANDFGLNGAKPTHPALLDWLACEFRANGQRLKPLHRLILLSSTYRQSPVGHPATTKRAPDGRLLWRFPPRRLTAEEVRDAMLSAAGPLNLERGGPSVIVPADRDLVDLLYDPAQWAVTDDKRQHDRRSVYLLAKRNLRLPLMEAFDRPDLLTSCPRRESSTHALQALELLNGKTSNRLADAFTRRLLREVGKDHSRQVERAWLLTAGRPPTEEERRLALRFLAKHPLREFALAMFNLNAFLYVR